MKKLLGILLVLALVLSFSLVATTPVAAANTWIVNPLGGGNYLTINEAVADTVNVLAGDTIELVDGEHKAGIIVIDRDLTITGQNKTTTIIKPTGNTGSSGDARGWFLVPAGNEFNLSNVTLDGAGYNIHQAIRSHGTGTIDNNIIKNIRYSEYIGLGMVGMDGSGMTFSNNTLTDIERIGMMAFGAGTTAQITGNTYTGKGPGDYLDYGIEIGGGAHATISGNTISGCSGIDSGWYSAAILITTYYGAGTEATITGNTLTGNGDAIFVGYDAADTSVVIANHNEIYDNDYGVWTNSSTVTTDATLNWWGDASGPSGQGQGTGDYVSANVDFMPWLMEEDGAETTKTDTGTGVGASASTTNVEATATGGNSDTTVTVGEYVGNPTSVSPGFRSGAVYIDVHVGGTLPTQLVVEVACPGTCSGVVLQWWDGADWMPVVAPTSVVSGKIQFVLSATSSPTIAQLTGTPFGLGSLSTVGWEGSPVNKAGVIAPWIALMAAMMAGAMLLVLRRRRAQI